MGAKRQSFESLVEFPQTGTSQDRDHKVLAADKQMGDSLLIHSERGDNPLPSDQPKDWHRLTPSED
jgi:hypothetical protein